MSTEEIKRLLAFALKSRKKLMSTSSGARRVGGLSGEDPTLKQVNMLIRNYRLELKRRASGDTSGNKGLGNKGKKGDAAMAQIRRLLDFALKSRKKLMSTSSGARRVGGLSGEDPKLKQVNMLIRNYRQALREGFASGGGGGGAGGPAPVSPSAKSSGQARAIRAAARARAVERARANTAKTNTANAERRVKFRSRISSLVSLRNELAHAIGQAALGGHSSKVLRAQLADVEREIILLSHKLSQVPAAHAFAGQDGGAGMQSGGKPVAAGKMPNPTDPNLTARQKKIAELARRRNRLAHAIGQAAKGGHSSKVLRAQLQALENEILNLKRKGAGNRMAKPKPPPQPQKRANFHQIRRPDDWEPIPVTANELAKVFNGCHKIAGNLKNKTGTPSGPLRHQPLVVTTGKQTLAVDFIKDGGRLMAISGKLVSFTGETQWSGSAKRRAI